MAGKNKGGREVRKPKKAKAPKSVEPAGLPAKMTGTKKPK
jgi:hypothetical protein